MIALAFGTFISGMNTLSISDCYYYYYSRGKERCRDVLIDHLLFLYYDYYDNYHSIYRTVMADRFPKMARIRLNTTPHLIDQCIPHLVDFFFILTTQTSFDAFIKYIPQFKKLRGLEIQDLFNDIGVDKVLDRFPQVRIMLIAYLFFIYFFERKQY